MARLLLAHPLFLSKSPEEQAASSPYFPLGLLYLAAYVRQQGHDVAIFDGTFCEDEQAFAASLVEHHPDVVGISSLQPTRTTALTLAAMAAQSGTVVVLGGPDPTIDPGSYLVDESVDLVVHHEGEQTITRLLDLHDDDQLTPDALAREPGIAYRQGGRAIVNDPRPPMENLDDLPLPARDLIDMDRYLQTWEDDNGYTSMTISTARGCPFGCDWCRDAVHGDGFRQRSPESVAAEVKQLADTYGIERLRVVDDVEGIDRTWFEAWSDAAHEAGAPIPFEPLNDIADLELPLLEVRDSL